MKDIRHKLWITDMIVIDRKDLIPGSRYYILRDDVDGRLKSTYCRYSGIFVNHRHLNDIIHSRFIHIIAYTHCKAYHWDKTTCTLTPMMSPTVDTPGYKWVFYQFSKDVFEKNAIARQKEQAMVKYIDERLKKINKSLDNHTLYHISKGWF